MPEIPACPKYLRDALPKFAGAELGISEKRFANVRSDLLAALKLAGAVDPSPARLHPMSPAFDDLWSSVTKEQAKWKLSRFFRFCSAQGLSLTDINDDVVRAFQVVIESNSFTKDPTGHIRGLIWAWNTCQQQIVDWPLARLSAMHQSPRGWTLTLADFPQSFQADLSYWQSLLEGRDPFADNALPRPFRPATIKHRLFQVRTVASALVKSGFPIAEVQGLGTLVEPENLRVALAYLYEKRGRQPSEALGGIVSAIKAIARHHVRVDPSILSKITRLQRRISAKEPGLTAQNRDRLRPSKIRGSAICGSTFRKQRPTVFGGSKTRAAGKSFDFRLCRPSRSC